jgi:hypothetical protein
MSANRGVFGSLEELRSAIDSVLDAAEQPNMCPNGCGRNEFLAALTAARTGIFLEEAIADAMQEAVHALSIGAVHAMNGLVAAANAAAARHFATLVSPRKSRLAEGQRGDINLTRAWLAA